MSWHFWANFFGLKKVTYFASLKKQQDTKSMLYYYFFASKDLNAVLNKALSSMIELFQVDYILQEDSK